MIEPYGAVKEMFLWRSTLTIVIILITLVSASAAADVSTGSECESDGGIWGRFGLMELDQCDMPTSDAGKQCFSHQDCESVCITDDSVRRGTRIQGTCYTRTVTLGTCLNYVEDGLAQGVICED